MSLFIQSRVSNKKAIAERKLHTHASLRLGPCLLEIPNFPGNSIYPPRFENIAVPHALINTTARNSTHTHIHTKQSIQFSQLSLSRPFRAKEKTKALAPFSFFMKKKRKKRKMEKERSSTALTRGGKKWFIYIAECLIYI